MMCVPFLPFLERNDPSGPSKLAFKAVLKRHKNQPALFLWPLSVVCSKEIQSKRILSKSTLDQDSFIQDFFLEYNNYLKVFENYVVPNIYWIYTTYSWVTK